MMDVTLTEATCIGCGCTDSRSCPGGCSWVWVKRDEGRGWCSSCHDADWEPDPMAAAAECAGDNAR